METVRPRGLGLIASCSKMHIQCKRQLGRLPGRGGKMSQQSGILSRLITQAVERRLPTGLSVLQHTKPGQQKNEPKLQRTLKGRLLRQRRSRPDQSLCTQCTTRRIDLDVQRFTRSRLLRNADGANTQLKSRRRSLCRIAVAQFTSPARSAGP